MLQPSQLASVSTCIYNISLILIILGESERERREREEEAQCLMLIWWLNLMQKTPCKTLPQTKRTSRAVSSAARSLHSPATSRHTWGYTPGRSPSPAPSVLSGSATAATGKNMRGFISGEPCSLRESHILLTRSKDQESCVLKNRNWVLCLEK